ncbi:sarcosine oxidase subunit delta [Bosea thiooxidans]
MRINCPHCGARDAQEFSYLGAAGLQRPDGLAATESTMADYVYLRDNPAGTHRELWYHGPDGLAATESTMADYVYLRDNPAGTHRELWYHGAGCHAWLVVTRDTRTHAIAAVETAKTRKAGAAA